MIRLLSCARLSVSAMIVAATLAACVGGTSEYNILAAGDQLIDTASNAVVAYRGLPPCAPGGTLVCQSPTVLASVQHGLMLAHDSFDAARSSILANPPGSSPYQEAIAIITAAVAALQAVMGQLPVAVTANFDMAAKDMAAHLH